MKKFITKSDIETKKFAENLAKELKGRIFALTGDLGSGKTTFVQGFAKGLGIKDKIISPTFVLIKIHKIPKSAKNLFHVDLYRLEAQQQFAGLGLEEIMEDPNNIVLIEWAEKAKKLLPPQTTKVEFKSFGENKREIRISGIS